MVLCVFVRKCFAFWYILLAVLVLSVGRLIHLHTVICICLVCIIYFDDILGEWPSDVKNGKRLLLAYLKSERFFAEKFIQFVA